MAGIVVSLTLVVGAIVGFLIYGTVYGDGVVDKICSFLLGGAAASTFFLLANVVDWVNDLIASRSARKASQESLKEMREAFNAQNAQIRSMRQLTSSSQQPPSVSYTQELFDDFDDQPLEGDVMYK